MTEDPTYLRQFETWRAERLRKLAAEDGWLNIIGRFWLEPGSVRVGTAPENDIVLSAGPEHVGTITQHPDGAVSFEPADGSAPLRLQLDKQNPPRFSVGPLLLEVTTLEGRHALRVRDREAASRQAPLDLRYFPLDPAWRKTAEWQVLDQPITMTVDTVLGIPTEVTITHKAAFTHDGARYELLPTHGTPEVPQFVLRDLTAKGETYPACRFLFGEEVTDRSIVLDFNKAINPPCAFTEHAVCPLPPPENVLPIRIAAGELKP